MIQVYDGDGVERSYSEIMGFFADIYSPPDQDGCFSYVPFKDNAAEREATIMSGWIGQRVHIRIHMGRNTQPTGVVVGVLTHVAVIDNRVHAKVRCA